MNKCHNCRFRNKDLTAKECKDYMFHRRTQVKAYCLNWKKEFWWQKVLKK